MAQPPPYQPQDPHKAAYPPQQPGYPAQPGYPPQGYPPPPGYGAPQQGIQQTTIIQQQPITTIVTGAMFGEVPVSMVCPNCQASIITATEYVPGTLVWIICIVIFFLFWPCCWLPFVIDGCKDVMHSCPNCRRQVGVFRRM